MQAARPVEASIAATATPGDVTATYIRGGKRREGVWTLLEESQMFVGYAGIL